MEEFSRFPSSEQRSITFMYALVSIMRDFRIENISQIISYDNRSDPSAPYIIVIFKIYDLPRGMVNLYELNERLQLAINLTSPENIPTSVDSSTIDFNFYEFKLNEDGNYYLNYTINVAY